MPPLPPSRHQGRAASEPPTLGRPSWVGADDIWLQRLNRAPGMSAALFLDRDGVLIADDVPYLHRPDDVRLLAGIPALIRAANRAGVPVVLVTNQGGIGLGKFDWPDFSATQERIYDLLSAEDAFLNAVVACPHHPKATGRLGAQDHPDRKPNPGMLTRASRLLPVDLPASWIIGDRASDLEAGKKAGLAGGILIGTGFSSGVAEQTAAAQFHGDEFQVLECPDAHHALGALPLFGAADTAPAAD